MSRRRVSIARFTEEAELPFTTLVARRARKFVPSALNRLDHATTSAGVTLPGRISSNSGQVFLTFFNATRRAVIEAGFRSEFSCVRASYSFIRSAMVQE